MCLDVGRRLVINGQILSSRITDFSSSGNHFILFTDIENNLFCVTLPRLKRFVDGQQSPRESFEKSFLTSGLKFNKSNFWQCIYTVCF